MKTPKGTARAARREDLRAFHTEQIKRREAQQGFRLFGDAKGAEIPRYFLDHLHPGKQAA